MRILIVDTYYPAFLREFTARQQAPAGYDAQWRALMDECFGTSDYYSFHLNALGHTASEVVANAQSLQAQWALEHGLELSEGTRLKLGLRRKLVPWLLRVPRSDWFTTVLAAQIGEFKPDVLYVQDMVSISEEFLRELKPAVRLIVGQTAYALPPAPRTFDAYDLIVSSFPHYVDSFRKAGLAAEYLKIGFEPRVLDKLSQRGPFDTTFVGGLSVEHSQRTALLEQVADATPLDIWGYGAESLPVGSQLRTRHHGNAWGHEMYSVLHGSRITLNTHINIASNNANNMRLYEATGVGALLLTDYKDNLHNLFDLEREVVSYRSPQECIEKVRYYLDHEAERAAIAAAGQARTLREHTYALRMQELSAILERHL